MFVKICGITRMKDAELAVELGASALGFVFWPESKRFIKPSDASLITEHLPSKVLAIGVFVNEKPERVNQICTEARLGAVQLHGEEPPEFIDEMTLPVIRAVPLQVPFDEAAISAIPKSAIVLLDAADRVHRGGTGTPVDWAVAGEVARKRTTILAGGLNATNVGEAIAQVSPHGVDVSSGVERSPGIKDPRKMKEFFRAVAAATVEPSK